MLDFHRDNNADVTIASIDTPIDEARRLGVIITDENLRITNFEEKPEHPTPKVGHSDISMCNMGVYCFNSKFLMETLTEHFREGNGADFGKDVFPKLLQNGAVIYAYPFEDLNRKDQPYWRDIGTLDAYYEANMDLVAIDPIFNLYDSDWPIKCFNKQFPPAKTVFNWPHVNRVGMALDSLISPGVIISGGRVEKSILSPEVRIHSHAYVYQSILFDNVEIGRGAIVRNAIIDSNAVIPDGARVGETPSSDCPYFNHTERGVCVISYDS